MKRLIVILVAISFFVGCNTNKNYLEINIVPESTVHMEKGEITILFADKMKNEIKRIEEEIFPLVVKKVLIPKDAHYFAYYMSFSKGIEPTVWFSGSNEELEIPENKVITIHANDPVRIRNLSQSDKTGSLIVSWETEEFADMYYLGVTFRNNDEVDIGNVNILLPNDFTSFEIEKIPLLYEQQYGDVFHAVKNRMTYIEGELPGEEFDKIIVRIEGMLIHSDVKLRYLTNSPKGSEAEYKVEY